MWMVRRLLPHMLPHIHFELCAKHRHDNNITSAHRGNINNNVMAHI